MSERLALFPGSFDPVTYGHLDILERSLALFDRVTILVARYGKAELLPCAERVALMQTLVPDRSRCTVEAFSGLLVAEIAKRNADAVVRGIRSAGDYEHEWGLAGVNSLLAPGSEYVYLLARPQMAAVSSSLVRDVARHGGDLTALVPPAVADALVKHYDPSR